jgi:hypothetical protein
MTANFYHFGEFELDRSGFELRHKGITLAEMCPSLSSQPRRLT